MKIFYNEQEINVPDGMTIQDLKQQRKPEADIMVVNGYPADADQRLSPGDHVYLICRGEQPSRDDLETLLMARHTPGVHETIKNSCIGIAGAGGLGSQVAVALARVGVGTLIIADFDIVEPSNLNRQQYFIDQIGLPKVDALADNLKRINPWTKVRPHQVKVEPKNIDELFAKVDILVEAFDKPDQKAMLAGHWLKHFRHRPLVAGSGMAGYGPSNSIATIRVTENFYLCGDGTSAAAPGQGLMAPRVGIAAHHQANAVLRLLLQEPPEATETS